MVTMSTHGMEQAPEAASVMVMHDARAVHDTALLQLTDLIGHQPDWIVAQILPAPQSGSATIPGASIRGDTGQFVVPAGATTVIMKQGTLNVLADSGQPASAPRAYNWAEPLDEEKRSLTPEDYYSPFVKGGIVILPGASASPVLKKNEPVYLIFDDWAGYVGKAISFVASNPDLFGKSSIPAASLPLLTRALSDQNALLQVQAFRSAVHQPAMERRLLQENLSTASIHLAAVYTYLMLGTPKAHEWSLLLLDLVNSGVSNDVCKGIALGAYSAKLFLGRDQAVAESADPLLSAVRSRLVGPLQADQYWKVLFAK